MEILTQQPSPEPPSENTIVKTRIVLDNLKIWEFFKTLRAPTHDPLPRRVTRKAKPEIGFVKPAVQVAGENSTTCTIDGHQAIEVPVNNYVLPTMPILANHVHIWETQIKERLENELPLHLRSERILPPNLFMVSDAKGTVGPCIVLTCWDHKICNSTHGREKLRRTVQKKLKSFESLKKCPYPCKVVIDTIDLLAERNSLSLPFGDEVVASLDHNQTTYVSHVIRACSTGRECTLGGVIRVGRHEYGLSIAHAFFESDRPLRSSSSSRDTREHSDEYYPSDTEESIFDGFEHFQVKGPVEKTSQVQPGQEPQKTMQVQECTTRYDDDAPPVLEPSPNDTRTEGTLGHVVHISTPRKRGEGDGHLDTDWSLIKLESSLPSLRNTYTDPQSGSEIELRFKHSNQIMQEEGVVRVLGGKSGLQNATLGQQSLAIRVEDRQLLVSEIILKQPLVVGDSGSWVVQGNYVVGCIVAGRHLLPFAYMIPMGAILRDIGIHVRDDDVDLEDLESNQYTKAYPIIRASLSNAESSYANLHRVSEMSHGPELPSLKRPEDPASAHVRRSHSNNMIGRHGIDEINTACGNQVGSLNGRENATPETEAHQGDPVSIDIEERERLDVQDNFKGKHKAAFEASILGHSFKQTTPKLSSGDPHREKASAPAEVDTDLSGCKPQKEQPSLPADQGVEKSPAIPVAGNAGPDNSAIKVVPIATACCLSLLLAVFDDTMVPPAIPTITDEFGSLSHVGWYCSSYLLAKCFFQTFYDRFYNVCSSRIIYVGSLLTFAGGLALSGSASSSAILIAGRTLCGVASIGVTSGVSVILKPKVRSNHRPLMQGILGSMLPLGWVVGPLIGGALTKHVGWRWCFYARLPPIAIIGTIILSPLAKQESGESESAKKQLKHVFERVPSANPVVIIVLVYLFPLNWGGLKYAWDNWRITLCLSLAALQIFALGILGRRRRSGTSVDAFIERIYPIISKPWKMKASVESFFRGGGLMVFNYYVPIWFQGVKNATALRSSVMFLPFVLIMVIAPGVSSGLLSRAKSRGPTIILWISVTFLCVGAGLLTALTPSSGATAWVLYQIAYGIGNGFGTKWGYITSIENLPGHEKDDAISEILLMSHVGGALFPSIAQCILNNKFLGRLPAKVLTLELLENPGFQIGANKIGATSLKSRLPIEYWHVVQGALSVTLTTTWYINVATALMTALAILILNCDLAQGKARFLRMMNVRNNTNRVVADLEVGPAMMNIRGEGAINLRLLSV